MARNHLIQANGTAGLGAARVRGFRSCPASASVSVWSPIATMLHTDGHKYGRPRRTEVST